MRNLNPSVLALAGIAAVLVTGPVAASVQSSASLYGLTWTLVDLDPLDGVVPEITFASGAIANGAFANSFSTLFETRASSGYGPVGDVSTAAPLMAGQTATASVAGTAQQTQLSLAATGTTRASVPGSFGSFDATADMRDWAFTLAPNTGVNFYAATNLKASTTGVGEERSFASVLLRARDVQTPIGPQGALSGLQDVSDFDYFSLVTITGESRRRLSSLSITFSNDSATDATGYLSATAFVSGYSAVAAVPEPESWALLLIGLGLVGAAARRKFRDVSAARQKLTEGDLRPW